MKRILFKGIAALALLFGLGQSASATLHEIKVSDFQFTPATLTIQLGDTVKWYWDGGAHTTTSSTIPAGATPWDAVIAAATDSLVYVPAVAGTYSYVCTPHVSMNMVASFVVVAPNAVNNIAGLSGFTISPNPAKTQVSIKADAKQMNVSLIDATGRLVRELTEVSNMATERVFSIEGVTPGVYLLGIKADGATSTERLMIQ